MSNHGSQAKEGGGGSEEGEVRVGQTGKAARVG